MEIPAVLTEMLSGTQGLARQMGARLVIDLGLTGAATEFIEVDNAHV